MHLILKEKESNIWLTFMVLVFRLAINFFKTYNPQKHNFWFNWPHSPLHYNCYDSHKVVNINYISVTYNLYTIHYYCYDNHNVVNINYISATYKVTVKLIVTKDLKNQKSDIKYVITFHSNNLPVMFKSTQQ